MDYLQEQQPGEVVTLKTQGSLYHSFYYYTSTGKADWLKLEFYDGNLDRHSAAEYYFLFGKDTVSLQPNFKTDRVYSGGMTLMKNQNLKYINGCKPADKD